MSTGNNQIEILYIEDDEALAFVTMENLNKKGYNITHCKDGLDAVKTFQSQQFDICILDIMLPHIDGYSIAQIIRNTNEKIPIIFLSAKSTLEDKLKALSSGGDDYLHKPFSINELIMRIQVFLRRSKENGSLSIPANETIDIGKYNFNPFKRELVYKKKAQILSNAESKLLYLLASNKNNIIYMDFIRARTEVNDSFSPKSLNTNISKLRKVLSEDPQITIENVREIGFRLKLD